MRVNVRPIYFFPHELLSAAAMQLLPAGQARREPHRGPGKHSRGAPKHFHGAPLGRKFLNFSFQNGTLYFWPTVGPPNVAGPGVANPPTPPSRWACSGVEPENNLPRSKLYLQTCHVGLGYSLLGWPGVSGCCVSLDL